MLTGEPESKALCVVRPQSLIGQVTCSHCRATLFELFFESASQDEISKRLHSEVYITQLEVLTVIDQKPSRLPFSLCSLWTGMSISSKTDAVSKALTLTAM